MFVQRRIVKHKYPYINHMSENVCFSSSEMCLWDIDDGRCVETTKMSYTHSNMQVH